MKESRELELKATITNTFLKTVSAFSNYNTGKIIFGVDDNGKIVGLENIEELCLDLENKINDNTSPKPDFKFIKDSDERIILNILEKGNILSSGEILEKVEFKKDKLNRLLKKLIQKNYIDIIGNGRGTKYFKK